MMRRWRNLLPRRGRFQTVPRPVAAAGGGPLAPAVRRQTRRPQIVARPGEFLRLVPVSVAGFVCQDLSAQVSAVAYSASASAVSYAATVSAIEYAAAASAVEYGATDVALCGQ